MKAVRLRIRQSSANYKKEETVDNKMTYPLPPPSTIIGAIHNACGYKSYHPMDISIQGKYESMHREPYTDYCFLNSVQDDRGILVKMRNGAMLSNAFEKVATAKKPQGNSFRNNITIQVHNEQLLKEYQQLKQLSDEIGLFKKERLTPVFEQIKRRKKRLAEKKKQMDKSDSNYTLVVSREKEIKELEKYIKARLEQFQEENYTKPISSYRSLTKSLKFYEVLNNIELVIHIKASDEVLDDILEHIYNLKSIGRSEDMVHVEEAVMVQLQEDCEDEEVECKYSAYINCDVIGEDDDERISSIKKDGYVTRGTKYYLNKNYCIQDGKRVFKKKKVLYISDYAVEEFGDGIYLDNDGDKQYIVTFI